VANVRVWLATVNRREFLFTGAGGLAGAIVGYLPIAPIDYSYALGNYMSAPVILYSAAAVMICEGCMGGFIVAAEGIPSRLSARVKQRFLRGFFISLVFGFFADVLGTILFESILSGLGGVRFGLHGEVVQGSLSTLPLLTLMFARTVVWSLRGALMGLGIGIATHVWTKPLKGLVGGLVGGFLAGMTLDPLTHGVHSRMAADLCGYMLEGLFLGLAIGLVYELTKTAWLTVDAGRLRDRQFRLEKARAIIGRAEECDIGLFGDPSVLGRHAQIERENSRFVISDLATSSGLRVNSRPVARASLNDGDQISIGNYVLTFHSRAKATGAIVPILEKEARSMSPPVVQNAWLINPQGRRIAVPAGGSLRIGREPDNSLVLDANTISRHHALIAAGDQKFQIKDLGSSNGTFLNGRRLGNEAVFLEPGDSVRFGSVSFQFQQEHRPPAARHCTKCGAGLREDSRLCPQCAAPITTRSDRSPGLSETSWYYERGGSRLGPVSASELIALCDRGDIEPDSVVWSPGLSTWRPLLEVEQFAEAISRPPSLPTTYVDNRAIWWLAVIPLFVPTLIALVIYGSGPGWTPSSAWWFSFWIFFCVNSGLIAFDHRTLKRSGHKPPHLWYLILVPLYLIMRSVKLRQTHAYTVVWFVTLLLGAPIARGIITGLR